jgi:hypothetical protein
MTTRIYYLPKSRISIHLINYMFERIGCSIGELRVNQSTNTIKVPITCNDNDVPRIERILKRYDMMEK